MTTLELTENDIKHKLPFKTTKIVNLSGYNRINHFRSTTNTFLYQIKPEALKSLYRSPSYKKKQLVLCKNYVLQSWNYDHHKKHKVCKGPSND